MISIDTESNSKKEMLCATAAEGERDFVFVPNKLDWLKEKAQDTSIPKVFANAKYDLKVLRSVGVEVMGDIHDVLLMAKCIYELWPSYSLKSLAYYYLGELYTEEIELEHWLVKNGFPKEGHMENVPWDILVKYARKDASITLRLAKLFLGILKDRGIMEGYDRDRAAIRPVWKMESNGVLIDRAWVAAHKKAIVREGISLRIQLKNRIENANFNINSIPQIAAYLKEDKIILPLTAKGNPSLTKRGAKEIDHWLISFRTKLQEISKVADTYCENLLRATAIHPIAFPRFNISEAATRRFSSGAEFKDEPQLNWQNFPKVIRRCVVVPPGRVGWYFDYTQIENIIHIFFSGDDKRRQAYESDENWSEYLWLAEQILHEKIDDEDPRYKRIKSTKLGMNFGMGAKTYAKYNGLPLVEAHRSFRAIKKACPAIKKLQEDVGSALDQYGYVEDVFGYRYHGNSDAAYKVVAYMIQGCAAALMKAAIVEVDKIPGVDLHLTVHDELYVTTADTPLQWHLARRVKKAMTNFSHLFGDIPIRVKVYRSTKNWLERERVQL